VPDLLPELGAGVLPDGFLDDLREVLVLPLAPGEADEAEAWGEQTSVRQVVDRRHDLLARQVAGDPEEDHAARSGDPGEASVPGVPQRVDRLAHACARPVTRDPRSEGEPRWSRSTGRPFSASTCPSPTACAVRNSWKVKGRPGTARSASGAEVTWR